MLVPIRKIIAISAAASPPIVKLVFIKSFFFIPAPERNLIRLKFKPSNEINTISDIADNAAEASPTSSAE